MSVTDLNHNRAALVLPDLHARQAQIQAEIRQAEQGAVLEIKALLGALSDPQAALAELGLSLEPRKPDKPLVHRPHRQPVLVPDRQVALNRQLAIARMALSISKRKHDKGFRLTEPEYLMIRAEARRPGAQVAKVSRVFHVSRQTVYSALDDNDRFAAAA